MIGFFCAGSNYNESDKHYSISHFFNSYQNSRLISDVKVFLLKIEFNKNQEISQNNSALNIIPLSSFKNIVLNCMENYNEYQINGI